MKKISVIDDSELNCILAKSILSDNYEVDYYMDPTIVIEKLKKDIPDMILLDIMMPEIDGLSLLKEIKKDDRLKSILVIMVTSLTDKNWIEEAISLGADDCLSKPIGNNDLLGLVNSYLL